MALENICANLSDSLIFFILYIYQLLDYCKFFNYISISVYIVSIGSNCIIIDVVSFSISLLFGSMVVGSSMIQDIVIINVIINKNINDFVCFI